MQSHLTFGGTTCGQGPNFDPASHYTPIRVEIQSGALPPIMGQSLSSGEGDDSPRTRHRHLYHLNHDLEEDSNNIITSKQKASPARSPGILRSIPVPRASNDEIESPSLPERNYIDSWTSHKRQDSWGSRGRPNERDLPDDLNPHNTTQIWPSMRSSPPPEKTLKAGVVRAMNGTNFPDPESRFFRPSALSPPTGPRCVKPHRSSPSRKEVFRRDWTSPDNSGNLEYRDREAIEKSRRKHSDSVPRHNFKPVADTYRPGYLEADRRYPNGRDRAYDDSSRSPPLRQGRDNTDKSYVPAHRSRDSTHNRGSQERSGSPLLRAREVAREVADRITRESLNNHPRVIFPGSQGQKRIEPSERQQTDLATGGDAPSSDAGGSLSQISLLSRGLLDISQRPSEHHSVEGDGTAIAPTESIQRSMNQVFGGSLDNAPLTKGGLLRTQSIGSEPSVVRGNPSTAILRTAVLHKENGVSYSSNVQTTLLSAPCTMELSSPPGTISSSRLPPKPPVIQPPNLFYEASLHILSGPLKPQNTTHLQPVEDAPSVNSDLTVATRKSASSISSASAASSEMRLRACHVCKSLIFSEYDGGIRCPACKNHFHRRCEPQGTSTEITQESVSLWRCSRCTKALRASSQFNTTPVGSSFDPSFRSSRQSPASIGPKTALSHTEDQPPRKKLKTETGSVAITSSTPDNFDARHIYEEIAQEKPTPTQPADGPPALTESLKYPQNSNGYPASGELRNEAHGTDLQISEVTNVLPTGGGAPPGGNLIALTTEEKSEPPIGLGGSNPILPPNGLHDSQRPLLSIANVSSHPQYNNALRMPVATDVPGVDTQASVVTFPWQAGTPIDPSKDLRFSIQSLRTSASSPKGSLSGTDQSTSSGTTSDIPRYIESANTSIGSPVPTTNFNAKETAASKADDELSDTSMSLDSTHSPSPDGKEKVVHENHHNSEPSSPPYSPRLDTFVHSDQGSAPTPTNAATAQLSFTNGMLGTQTTKTPAEIGHVGWNSSSPKRPSSTFPQCSKCSKWVFKGSTGGADGVLCGNCTNRETSQSRQSPPSGSVPVKGYVPQGPTTHISQPDVFATAVNPFIASASPALSTPGDLYLPFTNEYISPSTTRRRPEPNPVPGLLIPPQKRRKPAAVARKVASVPNHTLETSHGNTSRPNMKKANELRTPEKARQQSSHATKRVPGAKPDSLAISTETELRLRLRESIAANEDLQKSLDRQKSALQNYASKTSSLSDDLKEKDRCNQELSADAKKLKDQLLLKEKRITELQDENKDLHSRLNQALDQIELHVAENKVIEEKLAHALKEKHQVLNEKQQAMEKSHQALMDKQLELQEQQKLLILERERAESIQKRQESTERKLNDSAAPTSSSKPTVSFADLEYDTLNPFEAYPDIEVIVGEIPTRTLVKGKPNSSRRFKKLGTRQRLDFALMDRRFIHRQRPGPPATAKRNNPGNSSDQGKRKQRSEAGNDGDPLDSSSSDDSDLEVPIEELVGAPAEIMPTIQENGRLCFRDGTLGTNGKLPRAKIFHKVGKLDIAGQIR